MSKDAAVNYLNDVNTEMMSNHDLKMKSAMYRSDRAPCRADSQELNLHVKEL